MFQWTRILLAIAFAISCGCDRTAPPRPLRVLPDLSKHEGAHQNLVVAKVNGTPIFAAEVTRQAAIANQTPREALDALVTIEALVSIANQKRLTQGIEAEEGWKQILAQSWVVRDLEPRLAPEQIPEATLRQFYDGSRGAFNHSRLVRVATLDLYAFSKNGPLRRQQARQAAQELALELQKMSPNPTIAQLQILEATKKWTSLGLKVGMTWQSETGPYSAKVGQAALALRDWGDLSGVVEDDVGFHIVMHQGERAELRQSFDEAKPILREGITSPWQQRQFTQILTELASKSNVVVTAEALVSQTLK